jgi:hypothetical protein
VRIIERGPSRAGRSAFSKHAFCDSLNPRQSWNALRDKSLLRDALSHVFTFQKSLLVTWCTNIVIVKSCNICPPCIDYTVCSKSRYVLRQRYAVAQRLKHCATQPKGRGIDSRWCHWVFHWHNPSDRAMALGSTQPLIEMSMARPAPPNLLPKFIFSL